MSFQGGDLQVGQQILQAALLYEEEGQQQAKGQQQVEGEPVEIQPGIAEQVTALPEHAAHQGEGHGTAGGGAEEVLHSQAGHLAEIAQGGFT